MTLLAVIIAKNIFPFSSPLVLYKKILSNMAIHKCCVIFGLIALAHAAFSSAQHRTYLRLTEQEFTMLPQDILLQCLIGLLITCYGVVGVAGNFKEIRASTEQETKTWDMLSNRGGFNIFHHRGKALFGC